MVLIGFAPAVVAENTDLSPGLDARGTDHTEHDHAGQILTAVDLSVAPETGAPARLDEADFSNADLSLADLSQVTAPKLVGTGLILDGARLSGGQWNESNLVGANLSFASGAAVDFSDAVLREATLEFSTWQSSSFVGADLSNVEATDASWIASDLTRATLVDAEMAGVGLRDSVLVSADLSGARLFLADLSRVDARCGDALEGTPITLESCPRFDGSDLSFASLEDAQFSFGLMVSRDGVAVDLEQSNLTRADFSDACFTLLEGGVCQIGPPAVAPNLVGTDLDGVIFDRAYLGGADLTFARGDCVAPKDSSTGELTQCPSFVGTNARLARLEQTRLVSPLATGWILHGADLTGASLTGLREPCDVPDTPGENPACLEFFAPGAESGAPVAVLQKVNLSSADIAGLNFSGLNLEEARLDEVDGYRIRTGTDESGESFEVIYKSSFSGANLSGASLVSADLEQADMSNANLTSADLSNAVVTGAIFTNASANNAVFDGVALACEAPPCQTLKGFLDLAGTSWVGGDLGGQDLSSLDLTDIDLRQANLQATVWNSSVLTGANFSEQDLREIDLSQVTKLVGARFDGANLTCPSESTCDPLKDAIDLTGVRFRDASVAGVSFRKRDLTGADFSFADLSGADLGEVTATEANFSSASVSGVKFDGAELRSSRFDSTFFACAADESCEPFAGALGLAGARFRAAGLAYVRFEGDPEPLDLSDADFSEANLVGTQFVNVNALGARFDLLVGVCAGSGLCADFSGATLSDGVRPASFVQAQLSGVSLDTKDLRGVDLSGASLIGSSFVGADLSGADLGGASLESADLTSANLAGTDLRAADFSLTTFASLGTSSPIPGEGGCTLGEGESVVDLRGAQLSDADFGLAINFDANCIQVDKTTTYDGNTTVFPEGFTLASEMTNVPEPSLALAQMISLLTLAVFRLRRRRSGNARSIKGPIR